MIPKFMLPGHRVPGHRDLLSPPGRLKIQLSTHLWCLFTHDSKSHFSEVCQMTCQLVYRQHPAQLVSTQDYVLCSWNRVYNLQASLRHSKKARGNAAGIFQWKANLLHVWHPNKWCRVPLCGKIRGKAIVCLFCLALSS